MNATATQKITQNRLFGWMGAGVAVALFAGWVVSSFPSEPTQPMPDMADNPIALPDGKPIWAGTYFPKKDWEGLRDFLENDDMAAASGGLVFINGLGAIAGPLVVGTLMEQIGPAGFYIFTASLFLVLVAYAMYRMTQRPTVPTDETGSYVAMSPVYTTTVGLEIAQEFAAETDQEGENSPTAL